MKREEFLDELTDNFPPLAIYSFDEKFRYDSERARLLEEVLTGAFEKYERIEAGGEFRYTIVADSEFTLEVEGEGEVWTKTFEYIADAFDIAEAAYRFFIVMPRVLTEGERALIIEKDLPIDEESYQMHDHCECHGEQNQVEIIMPPNFTAQGTCIKAAVYLCTDGSYVLSVSHRIPGKPKRCLLDKFYSDPDFAALIAAEYVRQCDTTEFLGIEEEIYERVYSRATH
jgi:hypothetical protein